MTRAAANDHPTIIASRARGRERAMACVRACGLRRCSGACGGDVGAMTEDPKELFALARACATRAAALDDDDGVLRSTFGDGARDDPFEASHFWALVYGEREDGYERRRREKMGAHLDRPVGWVVAVTLGRGARMTIGKPPEKGEQYGEFASHRALGGQSAETAAETASLIAVCRATSPNTPRNTRPRIPPSREGLTPHAACAMANAHACSGVHPMPLTTLSPRLTRAPTAAAPRWWMIAAMTAFTVFESPDVQAARSNVAMPALVFIVAMR